MKRMIRSLLYVFSIMGILLLQGKTDEIDITYQDTINRFNDYEVMVNDFIENPSEEKIVRVTKADRGFSNSYYSLVDHQTFYNKLFKIEPILTKTEKEHLNELRRMQGELDKKYVKLALKEVYKASDFTPLVDQAKKQGGYEVDRVALKRTSKNGYEITIRGTFYNEDHSNILTRYFIIETDKGNFYWKKPDNYSISMSDGKALLTVGKTKYTIIGEIRFSGF